MQNSIDPLFKKKYKKSKKNSFPSNKWYDTECKQMRNKVNEFAHNYNIATPEIKTKYRQLTKIYKSLIQRKKRQFQEANRQELNKLLDKDQSTCWQFWNKMKGKNKINNCPTLETFHQYFCEQATPPSDDYFDHENIDNLNITLENNNSAQNNSQSSENLYENICDSVITDEEVLLHIKKLKNNKASGNDGIPSEFYKYAAEKLVVPFGATFNHVFNNGEYPRQWSEGLINALHKKGDHINPDNYRKITINVAMGKIFDSILNARLYFKNEALQLDDPFQFGFTPSSRTTDCVFILLLDTRNPKENPPIYVL